jgi:geranylgeranyl reductase family protein
MTTADVAVVGGGPAGAAAAIGLARAGRDVVLVDKATFPRDKCCGDGLTTSAIRQLRALGLDAGSVDSWHATTSVVMRSPSGREIAFPLACEAAVARRTDLDAALLDRARHEGVKVHDGCALVGARIADGLVTLDVEGLGDVLARYAIGADGMWSPLRKALGVDEGAGDGTDDAYLGDWHAFRQYFSGVAHAADELRVWFEPDLLPGYAWSFPLGDGRANVGFGILRRRGQPTKSMRDLWPELLARDHIRGVLGTGARAEAMHKAWPIPTRIEHAQISSNGGRVLFVGDAARAGDPMTGEGIGQALETAALAAASILAAGPTRPDRASQLYERAVQRGLARDSALAGLLSRALAHRKGARGAIRIAGSTAFTRRHFARWLFEDYPRSPLRLF